MIVYGVTNTLASRSDNVGTWYYAWERHIPFVPILIIPYFSIDLFFFFAPFLCTSREERLTLAKRILLAIGVAGLFFWLMPLTTAVPRPNVESWLGPIFRFLYSFDQPHNLFPSLHIALRTILVGTYVRHARGVTRSLIHVWFSLIGFSTLLVYQHHVVDIVGGFVLAAICYYVFVERADTRPLPQPLPRGEGSQSARPTTVPRIGNRYAVLSLLLIALSFTYVWWSLWLLWPAASLAIAASSYFGAGASIYRKRNGQIPIWSKLILGPFLAGQWISWLGYTKRSNAFDRVTDRVLIGRRLTDREAEIAVMENGIVAVLDLTGEFSEAKAFRALPYCNIEIADLTAPSQGQLVAALAFVEEHATRGTVYIHCKAGYSRSAAVAGAVLLRLDPAQSVEAIVQRLHTIRRGIVVRPEIIACLAEFRATLVAATSR
jgi:membrane-associated phospholipid phosphatase